ncbi:glycoside hydrolase family 3 protein [uncultured Oscillibacter sp.]|uniref:glycoside hydrolase family 3 protein n=1 Tax=uncultured Oscillibacter sp. TaxID=876091 RepID=UPI0025DE4DFC|nr:glycoside hydrolase family 3 N-terminal domain-containing protein [uncultured Oscillibacter sp.]
MRAPLPALLALSLLLTACGASPAAEAPPPPPPPAEEEPLPPPPVEEEPDLAQQQLDDLIASMSLAEQVGQLFFARCPASDAAADVASYHLGGYVLFGRDYQDGGGGWLTAEAFTQTVQSYQDTASIPLLIGSDEEGGTVTRASRNPNLFPEGTFRSPQALLARGKDGEDPFAADAREKSAALARYGINVNLAPVCDVSTDPSNFIYDRTLGQDAQATAAYVASVVGAMRDAGMGSVLKHFPGYGSNADTHTGIALDTRPLETFRTSDLLPFSAGIAAGGETTAILVSHNIIQCMDPDLPASLSPAVHRLLREELGFEGVVMTDDLAMDAVAAYSEEGAVAVLALEAGNDLILTTDYRTQIPKVLEAVQSGALSQETVTTACRRVLRWKQALGLL